MPCEDAAAACGACCTARSAGSVRVRGADAGRGKVRRRAQSSGSYFQSVILPRESPHGSARTRPPLPRPAGCSRARRKPGG
eukprot:scaffold4471_cov238-Prasinococcus_capsulatus_cf.AAC.1